MSLYNTTTSLLITTLLLLTSCIKEPEACIDFESDEIEAFELVEISSCSENAESLEWEVETSNTRSEEYESESFTESWDSPGNYNVKLTAYSKKEKKKHQVNEIITVKDICHFCEDTTYNESIRICVSDFALYGASTGHSYQSYISVLGSYGMICTKE